MIPTHFLPLLQRRLRTQNWVTALLDRKYVLIARSRQHDRFSGMRYDAMADASKSGWAIQRGRDLEGRDGLRALATSKVSAWVVAASVP